MNYRFLVGIIIALTTSLSVVHAEYLKTGNFTYQNSNERTKVIVVPETEKPAGIFILKTAPQPIQLFDVSTTTRSQSTSVFFLYDKTKRRFVEMHVGEDVFDIQGSLTLHLGSETFPRISLDQNGANPYLSILEKDDKKSFSILSFLGVLEVMNRTGENADLFEANALQNQNTTAIKNYRISDNNVLKLDNVRVEISQVGIKSGFSSKCNDIGSIVLQGEKIQDVRALNRQELTDFATKSLKKSLSLENLLPLRSEGDDFFGFDYLNEDIIKVYYLRKLNIQGTAKNICVAEYVTSSTMNTKDVKQTVQ